MDNIRIYQERNVKELLAKLENTLVTIHQYVNSYLAYNLRMLAAAIKLRQTIFCWTRGVKSACFRTYHLQKDKFQSHLHQSDIF